MVKQTSMTRKQREEYKRANQLRKVEMLRRNRKPMFVRCVTMSMEEAGRYTLKRATDICLRANKTIGIVDDAPNEAIVPIDE
jgi:hypothetical protein